MIFRRRKSAPSDRFFRWDIYRRLWPYAARYKLPMAVVMGITVVQVGMTLLDPWPMQILVDSGLLHKRLPGWISWVPFLGSATGATVVVFAVFLGLGLRIIANVFDITGSYLKDRINGGMTLLFKADLFRHLQRLSFSYHDRTTVGDSLYRVNTDSSYVSLLIWSNFRHLLTAGLSLVGMVFIVVHLDWQLALLALGAGPLVLASAAIYSRFFKRVTKQVRGMESLSQTVVQEVLSCLRVVKAFGTEDREQRRFEERSWTALRARIRLSLQQNVFSYSLSLVTKVFRSVVLLIGALHVLDGRITVGELLVIQAYVGQIHGPMEDMSGTLTEMQTSLASAERVFEVLDVEPDVQDAPGARALDRVDGAIAFEAVSFAYPGGHEVLHEIDVDVPAGRVIAIVGPTGAGKTTLSNLIARFYDPTQGRVTLDGHNLRDLTVQTLRDNISLVIQEPILFTGTIRENIAYARPEASMADIISAARAANAHDFISGLPDGYDTQVGERGARLSGGERQRVAIARAFLKDAPVLILDEPTSSLDSQTELVILRALDRLMAGRTTFIIAHRLSTIRRADQVLVMECGRIVERGSHAALIRQNGLYAQLYHIQMAALRESEEAQPTLTVAEWITDGKPGITHEEIVAAAMGAEADDFINELPHGYETVVGEKGVELSAEQREKLAAARTLLAEIADRRWDVPPRPATRKRA